MPLVCQPRHSTEVMLSHILGKKNRENQKFFLKELRIIWKESTVMFLTEKSHTQNLLNKYSWSLSSVSSTNVLCFVDGKERLEIVLKLKFIFQALGEEELSPFLPCVLYYITLLSNRGTPALGVLNHSWWPCVLYYITLLSNSGTALRVANHFLIGLGTCSTGRNSCLTL